MGNEEKEKIEKDPDIVIKSPQESANFPETEEPKFDKEGKDEQ